MKEFELKFDEALRIGLSPLRYTPSNMQLLYECLGFRVGRAGLELYSPATNPLPITTNLLYDWPFPQYVTGERYNFLVVRDNITNHEDIVYHVSDDHSVVTYITNIPFFTYGTGTLMEVADFGLYAFLTNGAVMIYYNPVAHTWHVIESSAAIPLLRTICNFKGQAFGGNVVGSWKGCDETYYVWSKIGEMDFRPDDKNTAGFRRCPFGGEVFHTRRLKDFIVGYSSKGITAISPVIDPAPTFGFTELDDIGVINQGALNGDLRRQVYVGEDYVVREVTSEGVKELGYESYMRKLDGIIIVSYDQRNKDFYIGDRSKTFLLSPQGMSEIPQHPSAVWSRGRTTHCLPDAIDKYKALITTESFDFGYTGQKTVFSIESNLIPVYNPEAAVDYFLNMNSYGTTNYTPMNNQGVSALIASGNAFRARIRFDPVYNDSIVSFIKVRYKMTDLRGIRGIYAPPAGGQHYAE